VISPIGATRGLFIYCRPLPNVLGCTFSDVRGRVCWQVNEPDYAAVQVEIRKADDASEAVEDKAPIKHEVNGDVEGTTSGGVFEGTDLDLADQTLVGDLSQDADASVVQEIAVSVLPI